MFSTVPLFAPLSEADRKLMESHCEVRDYPKGALLIREGDAPKHLFVVRQGRLKAYKGDARGRHIMLATFEPGDHFGELALIDEAPRSASVEALSDCSVALLSKGSFQQCLCDHPEIAINLIQALAQRVRSTTNMVKDLALMDVYGRVANTLLQLSRKEGDKRIIEPRPTHQEIASMVGSSREMVSRILKDLTFGGYVIVQRSALIIKNKLPDRW